VDYVTFTGFPHEGLIHNFLFLKGPIFLNPDYSRYFAEIKCQNFKKDYPQMLKKLFF
jgi:hypothetical protein